MASDSVAARIQSLEAGLAEIEPQIKGLRNKIPDDISPDLKASLSTRLALLDDRKAKILAAIAAQGTADSTMEILEDDGFPALPDTELPQSQFAELQEEGAADDAAAAGFEVVALATSLGISLGTPADKP